MPNLERTSNSVKWIFYSFLLFNIISYIYVLSTGTYNGDFLGMKTKLNSFDLFLNLLLCFVPFVCLFLIHKHYSKVEKETRITVPLQAFGTFLFLNISFQIFVTLMYGVGRLGQEIYEAPTYIKIFIQIFNRFDTLLGVSFFSAIAGRTNRFQYLLWLMVVCLSILRASASIFVVIVFVSFILNYSSIIYLVKRYMVVFVCLIVFAPIMITSIYSVREQLRQNKSKLELKAESDKIDNVKLIGGKVIGRLSSFTNSAVLMEREGKILDLARNFTIAQYPKEALSAVYGKILNFDDIAYKNLLFESSGSHIRTYTSMNGTQGVLLISFHQSIVIFIVNLCTILLIVLFSYELLSLLHIKKINDVFFLFFSLTVMSGGAVEFMDRLMVIFLYSSMFVFLNMLKIPKFKLSK